MAILHWYWSLKLRWRIPLGAAVLLGAVAGITLLVAWLHFRQCGHLDLIDLVPGRLPLVARCRDGGTQWDRIRGSDVYRVLEAQVRRRGPLVRWAESVSGRPWEDLTAPLTAGPAAGVLTESRLRGLLGRDVVVAMEDASTQPGGPVPRAVFLTRIGFLEYLAYPLVRRLALGRAPGPVSDKRYRRVDLYRLPIPRQQAGAPEGVLAFAVKGDILAVATDDDLLLEVVDRTFSDWMPAGDSVPWALPGGVPLALGADLHRLGPVVPNAQGVSGVLGLFPVREMLLPLDPGAMGRCTLAVDVDRDGVRLEASVGLRPGAVPLAPLAPEPGASPPVSAVPDDAIAFVEHRVDFREVLELFVKVTLDPARKVAAGDALGEPFLFFQRQARDVELPALLGLGLKTHLLPRLRGGIVLALTQEAGPPPKTGEVPNQTGIVLVGTTGGGDAAETALHDLLQARAVPLNARIPNDLTETLLPAGDESLRFLRRRSWPVQFAYGESRGVLAFGVRPDAVARSHEAVQGRKPDVTRAPRYQAVRRALAGSGAIDEASPGSDARLLSRLYVDARRLGAMLREVAPDLALFAKDRIDGPRLRATLETRTPRQPAENPAAYQQRITGLFEAEVARVVDEARLRIEAPAMILDPFGAAGLEIEAVEGAYRVKAVLQLNTAGSAPPP